MTMENQLEAEKMKFTMLTALTNPNLQDSGKYREWSDTLKKVWSSYLSYQFGIDVPKETEDEIKMREYYETVVKHVKPKVRRNGKSYFIEGLDSLL